MLRDHAIPAAPSDHWVVPESLALNSPFFPQVVTGITQGEKVQMDMEDLSGDE